MIRLDCAFFICMKAIKGGLPVTEQKTLIVPNEEEKIIQIEIERLTTFKDHQFKVQEDEDMKLKSWDRKSTFSTSVKIFCNLVEV